MNNEIDLAFICRARQESAAQQLLAQLFSEELDANTTRGLAIFSSSARSSGLGT